MENCRFEGAHQAGCSEGEPECLPCALALISRLRVGNPHCERYRLSIPGLIGVQFCNKSSARVVGELIEGLRERIKTLTP